jgi:hypothetical protein
LVVPRVSFDSVVDPLAYNRSPVEYEEMFVPPLATATVPDVIWLPLMAIAVLLALVI